MIMRFKYSAFLKLLLRLYQLSLLPYVVGKSFGANRFKNSNTVMTKVSLINMFLVCAGLFLTPVFGADGDKSQITSENLDKTKERWPSNNSGIWNNNIVFDPIRREGDYNGPFGNKISSAILFKDSELKWHAMVFGWGLYNAIKTATDISPVPQSQFFYTLTSSNYPKQMVYRNLTSSQLELKITYSIESVDSKRIVVEAEIKNASNLDQKEVVFYSWMDTLPYGDDNCRSFLGLKKPPKGMQLNDMDALKKMWNETPYSISKKHIAYSIKRNGIITPGVNDGMIAIYAPESDLEAAAFISQKYDDYRGEVDDGKKEDIYGGEGVKGDVGVGLKFTIGEIKKGASIKKTYYYLFEEGTSKVAELVPEKISPQIPDATITDTSSKKEFFEKVVKEKREEDGFKVLINASQRKREEYGREREKLENQLRIFSDELKNLQEKYEKDHKAYADEKAIYKEKKEKKKEDSNEEWKIELLKEQLRNKKKKLSQESSLIDEKKRKKQYLEFKLSDWSRKSLEKEAEEAWARKKLADVNLGEKREERLESQRELLEIMEKWRSILSRENKILIKLRNAHSQKQTKILEKELSDARKKGAEFLKQYQEKEEDLANKAAKESADALILRESENAFNGAMRQEALLELKVATLEKENVELLMLPLADDIGSLNRKIKNQTSNEKETSVVDLEKNLKELENLHSKAESLHKDCSERVQKKQAIVDSLDVVAQTQKRIQQEQEAREREETQKKTLSELETFKKNFALEKIALENQLKDLTQKGSEEEQTAKEHAAKQLGTILDKERQLKEKEQEATEEIEKLKREKAIVEKVLEKEKREAEVQKQKLDQEAKTKILELEEKLKGTHEAQRARFLQQIEALKQDQERREKRARMPNLILSNEALLEAYSSMTGKERSDFLKELDKTRLLMKNLPLRYKVTIANQYKYRQESHNMFKKE